VVTYKSFPPKPPGRAEKKESVVPSKENAGAAPNAVLFTVGPRFVRVVQGSLLVARVETHRS